jgi:lysylphosphatidylglycerol synthetase-like protein (DUF2156 family)
MKRILTTLALATIAAALFFGMLWQHTLFTHELLSKDIYSNKYQAADRVLRALFLVQLVFTVSLIGLNEHLQSKLRKNKGICKPSTE